MCEYVCIYAFVYACKGVRVCLNMGLTLDFGCHELETGMCVCVWVWCVCMCVHVCAYVWLCHHQFQNYNLIYSFVQLFFDVNNVGI